jgi:hypothetical protein
MLLSRLCKRVLSATNRSGSTERAGCQVANLWPSKGDRRQYQRADRHAADLAAPVGMAVAVLTVKRQRCPLGDLAAACCGEEGMWPNVLVVAVGVIVIGVVVGWYLR